MSSCLIIKLYTFLYMLMIRWEKLRSVKHRQSKHLPLIRKNYKIYQNNKQVKEFNPTCYQTQTLKYLRLNAGLVDETIKLVKR